MECFCQVHSFVMDTLRVHVQQILNKVSLTCTVCLNKISLFLYHVVLLIL